MPRVFILVRTGLRAAALAALACAWAPPAASAQEPAGAAALAAAPTPEGAGAAPAAPGPGAAPAVVRGADGRVTVRATRISDAIAIDGALDESLYARIPAIDGFLQQEPREGQPATQKTDAWLFYDDRYIYVAARCWSDDPSRIVANELRRDGMALFQNDNFAVLFDTFHDRRNGFMFQTNPLGAVGDTLVTDERDLNRDWNTVWDVRARRFDRGWTLEMAIPFRSLRYPAPGPQEWGVQIRRVARGINELSYVTPMPAAFAYRAMTRVSQAATLVGLEAPKSGLSLDVKPFALGKVESDLGAAAPFRNDAAAAAGVDVKKTFGNGLVADVTVNTDFAQVEDDEQQVNLTRYSLFFPERRDFFLEGAGIFAFGGASVSPRGGMSQGPPNNTPILFYSRRIGLYETADGEETGSVPIAGGARLTGRVGAYTIGALGIGQRRAPASGDPATAFSVVRLKRDILKQSSVGVLFTNRSHVPAAGGSNQAAGADAAFTFLKHLTLNAYAARTRTAGVRGNDASYLARAEWMGDRYGAAAEHLVVEKNFRPEAGFLRREDFRRNFGMVRFSPRPANASTIRKLSFEAAADRFANTAGRLETQEIRAEAGVELQNGDEWRLEGRNTYEQLDEAFEITDGIVLPVGGYRYSELEARYMTGGARRLTGSWWVSGGRFYSGTRREAGYRGRLGITPRIGVEPGVSFNWVKLAEGSFVARLLTARINYAVSARQAFSALLQYNSEGSVVGANLRFRWEFKPGSDVFIVYNEGRDTTLGIRRSEMSNRSFAIKITRLLRF
ncbi:MAG TPA: DUF5916 domain-containing protein [Vicinamibacterales bacterium]|nr:DUF5916 domain-containing protein [Vicinamibacterales bacterium]HPW19514.1 DUF5916 domain-containing protein [Vicinamibacterales bacterium]